MYDSKKLNWIVAIPLFVAWIVYGMTLKDVPVHFSGESAVSMAQPEASNSKNSQGSSNASSSQPTSTLLWISWSFKLLLFAFGLFGTLLALFQRRAWRKLIVATSLIF